MAVAFVAAYTPATNPILTGSAWSVSITVAAGDCIVLSVSCGATSTVATAPSGGGLVWTQRIGLNPGTGLGALYVYTAISPSGQTFTASGALTASGDGIGVTAARYSGVGGPGAITAVSGPNSTNTAPTMSFTAQNTNAIVHMADTDFNAVATTAAWSSPTGATATVITNDAGATVADHTAYYTITTSGAKTLAMTTPNTQRWNLGAIELLPLTAITLPGETGTGADALTVTATVPLPDTGAGADALTVAATVGFTESGTGTDTLSAGIPTTLPGETGTGADALTVTARTIFLADSFTGADSFVGAGPPVIAVAGVVVASPNLGLAVLDSSGVQTSNALVVLASPGAGVATLASPGLGEATVQT